MNLASIDIGSNGARLLIKSFNPQAAIESERIKKLMFVRIPLRLGKDVFTLGKVSKERERMMMHMIKGFKQFMKLYEVEAFRACATSAMRDAENGQKVLKKIERETGIALEIIGGQEEAQLLFNNLVEKTDSHEGNFAYIDVGGGSTEVSIIHDGKLADSYSYNMGTLRMISGKVTGETEKLFRDNLMRYAQQYDNITIIGSGGNINKLNKLASGGRNQKSISIDDLRKLYDAMKPLSIEQRMETFKLKEDRADVIIPAAEIFIRACEYLNCETVMVPNISLADSIVDGLYEKMIQGEE